MDAHEYIDSKTENKDLRSHLHGILKELGYDNVMPSEVIGAEDESKLWGKFVDYTGVTCHAEILHGKKIHLHNFLDSAIESWGRERGD